MYRDLLGKPFKWGGRGPDAFDCYGVIYEIIGRRLGYPVDDPLTYSEDPRAADVDVFGENVGDVWIPVSWPFREYDVLLFDQRGNGCATHCGMWDGAKCVFQAVSNIGVVSIPWRRMKDSFLKAYRHQCLA